MFCGNIGPKISLHLRLIEFVNVAKVHYPIAYIHKKV